MKSNGTKWQFSCKFRMPVDRLMTFARDSRTSPDENLRSVAKAMLDLTAEALKIQKAVDEDGTLVLDPYFDFWFADAIACANRLLDYGDKDARDLAQCLVAMERATIESKESFLVEMKRLGIQPKRT